MSEITSFYKEEELKQLGLKSYGKNVLISRKCSIYSPYNISIGNNVRIDDFCILSGNITLRNYVHISAYCALYGGESGIEFMDYSGISARGTIYAESDDFSGNSMTNPMLPTEKRNVIKGKVIVEEYVQIGAHSIVMPNVIIRQGCAIGAMSLVNHSLDEWGIYASVPAKRIKERSRKLLDLI